MATQTIPYKTMYGEKEFKAAPTGTRYDQKYRIEYSKTGHKLIVPDGTTDRYAIIQSHSEECNIENIIAKSKLDPSVLNRKVGQYGDFTKMPKSLAEAQNMIVGIKQEFYKLPIEVREKFNNSPEQYVAQYGTKTWMEATGYGDYIKTKENLQKPKDEEVGTDAEQ